MEARAFGVECRAGSYPKVSIQHAWKLFQLQCMRIHCSFPCACRHWYILVLHRIAVEGALHFNIFTLNSRAGLFSESLLGGVKRWVARSLFLSAPVKAVERYDSLFSELSVPYCPQQPGGVYGLWCVCYIVCPHAV